MNTGVTRRKHDYMTAELGKVIRDSGVKYQTIADDTGINYYVLSRICGYTQQPLRADDFYILCQYFGVTPDELYTRARRIVGKISGVNYGDNVIVNLGKKQVVSHSDNYKVTRAVPGLDCEPTDVMLHSGRYWDLKL